MAVHSLLAETHPRYVTTIDQIFLQRMAPAHKRSENPPSISLMNLMIAGVVFGGVRAFGPSRASRDLASDSLKPWNATSYKEPDEQCKDPTDFHGIRVKSSTQFG